MPTQLSYTDLEKLQHNLTALHELRAPPWVNGPNMRGTSEILFSCLLTLFACIYTALHLNVPRRTSGSYGLFKTKCLWSLAALAAPEIVLFYASHQFFEARALVREFKRLEREGEGEGVKGVVLVERPAVERDNKCRFDLKYGFFAAMGGFELKLDEIEEPRTLSTEGVRKFAQMSLDAFRTPPSFIRDRSRADVFQKCLVLVQVGWMALQCAARRAYGLPITLLELHTIVHVVCAVIMYAFWFEKPLDLRDARILGHAEFANCTGLKDEWFCPGGANLPGFRLSWLFQGDLWNILEAANNQYGERYSVFILLAAFLLPAAYGGVHLSAWHFEFPTGMEWLLWVVSCFIIISGLLVGLGAFLVVAGLYWCLGFGNTAFIRMADVCFKTFLFIFVVARLYIVVEVFVSLRAVPVGVYWTPAWIQMIPHV